MNQDNNFPRFGHQQQAQYGLGQPPQSFDTQPQQRGFATRVFGPAIGAKLSSPLFATAALVVVGAAFAAIVIAAYPDDKGGADVPVVTADASSFKAAPDTPGGLQIENRDTTIFSAIEGLDAREPAPIENLLDDGETTDKLAAFARQVEQSLNEEAEAIDGVAKDTTAALPTLAKAETADEPAPVTLQKIASNNTPDEPPAPTTTKAKVTTTLEKPKIVHKPGENPETLEFVRSVLDKKDGSGATVADVATQAAAVQPAAGNATRDFTITPGSHYVQVGSVKSLDGAAGQWNKIREEFSAELGSAPHRVQSADLGERGTFFRIQAGPMSKDSASSICDSIKSQKPGGCLVTQ